MKRRPQPDHPHDAVIRVFSKNGNYFGTGAYCLSGYVVTCAHVVRDALGMSGQLVTPPTINGRIRVDFPLLRKEPEVFEFRESYEAELPNGGWGPEQGWRHENDIAILKIVGEAPFEVGILFDPQWLFSKTLLI